MELFGGLIGWLDTLTIVSFLQIAGTIEERIAQMLYYQYICIGVGCGLYLVGLIMGGFGLYTMAKRAGVKHGWLGFLPFGNTYLSGKLAGQTNVFGAKMKNPGLWAMLVEIVFVALNIFSLVIGLLMQNAAFYAPEMNEQGQIVAYVLDPNLMPVGMRWMVTASGIIDIACWVFMFAIIFFFCTLYFALFRKYYARSPFLMTFLCALLPARGFVLFAVRKNTPVDYNAFLQQRMRQAQQQYGGGYGGQGGYAPPSPPPQDNRPEEPFPDFGMPKSDGPTAPDHDSGHDSPFSDF